MPEYAPIVEFAASMPSTAKAAGALAEYAVQQGLVAPSNAAAFAEFIKAAVRCCQERFAAFPGDWEVFGAACFELAVALDRAVKEFEEAADDDS